MLSDARFKIFAVMRFKSRSSE